MATMEREDSTLASIEAETERTTALLKRATEDEVYLLHQILLEGAVFLKYGKRGHPKYKTVVCNPRGKEMLLQWSEVPEDSRSQDTPPPSGWIRLSDITMLLKGKQSKVYQRKVASAAPEWLCFSIVTKKRTLDLQAHSGNQRDLWVRAIAHMVMSHHARKVQGGVNPAAAAAAGAGAGAGTIAALPSTVDAPSTTEEDSMISQQTDEAVATETEEAKMMQFLGEGGRIIKHGRSGQPNLKRVFCSKGKIWWCKPNVKPHKAKTHFPLSKIKGILIGKKTLVLHRKPARNVASHVCLSIVTEEKTLDLQCESKEERDHWVKCLRFAVKNAKEREELLRRIIAASHSSGALHREDSLSSEQAESSLSEPEPSPLGSNLRAAASPVRAGAPAPTVQEPLGEVVEEPSEESEADAQTGEQKQVAAAAATGAARSRAFSDSEPDSPPPPPPPPPSKATAAKNARERGKAEKRAQERREQKKRAQEAKDQRIRELQKKNKEDKKSRKASAAKAKRRAQADARERAREVREMSAASRREAEQKARQTAMSMVKNPTEASAHAHAEALAEEKSRQQEEAVANAQRQRQELEMQLKGQQDRANKKRGSLNGTAETPAAVVAEAEAEAEAEGAQQAQESADAELKAPEVTERKIVGVLSSPGKKKKKKGIVWAEQIENVKVVEKIIILAPDYDDEDLDDAGYDLDDEDDRSDDEDDYSDGERDNEDEEDDGDDPDEEEKARSLETITRPKAFIREIQKHMTVLHDLEQEWTVRVTAMNTIEDTVRNKNVAALGGRWWAEMDQLKACIGIQLEDLRSSIVKEACNLLITLTDVQGHLEEFVPVLKHVLPILFRRLYVTIRVISTSADECVRAVLTRAYFWSFRTIPEMLKSAATDTHSVVRSKCTEYLTQILNECPDDQFSSVFVYEKKLASLIKKNINDTDKTVRFSARQLFLAFANVWPQLAHKLYDKFNTATQRTITAELKKMMD